MLAGECQVNMCLQARVILLCTCLGVSHKHMGLQASVIWHVLASECKQFFFVAAFFAAYFLLLLCLIFYYLLQGMVDELMMKKLGRRMRRPQDRDKSAQGATFMKRDGTVLGEPESEESVGQKAKESVKRLSVCL